tara:strand:+ start:3985 stop:4512 length:528 start_codon:yes stop_codon:yes gene_type:complete
MYCSVADVGLRLGLNSAQRVQANTKILSHIRRASIEIDQEFKYYGRATPSQEIGESTLSGAHTPESTTVDLASGTSFSNSGKGNIDGDSFQWTGKSSNQLTGVTGITLDHASGVTVQEGEMAHVLREICADLAASLYLEDESTFQRTDGEGMRASVLRERTKQSLTRLAHLGGVI